MDLQRHEGTVKDIILVAQGNIQKAFGEYLERERASFPRYLGTLHTAHCTLHTAHCTQVLFCG